MGGIRLLIAAIYDTGIHVPCHFERMTSAKNGGIYDG